MNPPINEETFAASEYPLDGLFSYVAVLMQRAPGGISFRTGSGRIFRDLLLHWPALDGWEDEAQELCQRIADAAYPLASALYAQAVEFNITISGGPILPPSRIDAMVSYIVFDADKRVERRIFFSPKNKATDAHLMVAYRGIVVLCRPLNYRYHTIKDDRGRGRGAGADAFGYTEKLINQMLDAPDFVPREQRILSTIKAEVKALPQTLEHAANAQTANLSKETHHIPQEAPLLAAVTSISALPAPIRALERRLFASITDKSLSVDLRLGLRRVAQSLREHSPQVVLEEAARRETVPLVLKAATPALGLNSQIRLPENRPTIVPTSRVNRPAAVLSPRPASPQISGTYMSEMPLSVRPSVVVSSMIRTPSPSVVIRRPIAQQEPHPKIQDRPNAQQPKPTHSSAPERSEPQGPSRSPENRQQTSQQEATPESRPQSQRQEQRVEGPRAEPPRAQEARQPERQPGPRSTRQQPTSEPSPKIEQKQPSASPQSKVQQDTRPTSRPNSLRQEEKIERPRIEPARSQDARFVATQPKFRADTKSPTIRQAPRFSPNNLPHEVEKTFDRMPRHSYNWDPETRPKDFYERLKNPEAKLFPKAIPIAPVGRLEKMVNLKQTQMAPSFQAAIHKQRLTATLPKLLLEPFPPLF